jgi:hypothetical protein
MLRWAPANGGVLEAAIDPGLLEREPVRAIGAYVGTDRSTIVRNPRLNPEDPAYDEALERLRGLGYIR